MKTTEELIAEFVANGGEITRLRYASKRDQQKAQRKWYHKDRALSGDERSKKALEEDKKKNSLKIFSPTDQWRV